MSPRYAAQVRGPRSRWSAGLAPALWIAAALLLVPHASAIEDALPEPDPARTLLERTYRNLYDHDFIQTLRLESRFRGGRSVTRRVQIVRRRGPDGGRALVRFLEPEDIRKTSLLLLEREEGYDDVYLYLPAFRLVKHLSVSQRADAFFGTDVSYEDLEPKDPDDFEARWLGPSRAGERDCMRLELRPRAGQESMYDRVIPCIDPERAVILSAEFHRGNELLKRLWVDATSIERHGRVLMPGRVRIETPRRGTETLVVTEAYEAVDEVPDSLFTRSNLELGDADRDRAKATGR